jgi:hypothetical protein
MDHEKFTIKLCQAALLAQAAERGFVIGRAG